MVDGQRVHDDLSARPSSLTPKLRSAGDISAGETSRTVLEVKRGSAPQERKTAGRHFEKPSSDDKDGASKVPLYQDDDCTMDVEASRLKEFPNAEILDIKFFGLAKIHDSELGYFSLAELEGFRGPFGLGIERDRHFGEPKLSEVTN
jgi:hypothetical protein